MNRKLALAGVLGIASLGASISSAGTLPEKSLTLSQTSQDFSNRVYQLVPEIGGLIPADEDILKNPKYTSYDCRYFKGYGDQIYKIFISDKKYVIPTGIFFNSSPHDTNKILQSPKCSENN